MVEQQIQIQKVDNQEVEIVQDNLTELVQRGMAGDREVLPAIRELLDRDDLATGRARLLDRGGLGPPRCSLLQTFGKSSRRDEPVLNPLPGTDGGSRIETLRLWPLPPG